MLQAKEICEQLWKYLSPESQAVIQSNLSYPSKSKCLDAIWLWSTILTSHYPGATFGTSSERNLGSQSAFYNLKMGPTQTIVDFYRECMISMEGGYVSEEMAGLYFLDVLNGRFDAFRSRMRGFMRNEKIFGGFTLSYFYT